MNIVRLKTEAGPRFGVLDQDNELVTLLAGDELSSALPLTQQEETRPLVQSELLPPVIPGKIVVIGRNYGTRTAEDGALLMHLKPSTAVIGPGDSIVLPEMSHDVRYEGELAVVIGRTCRRVDVERANEYVLGYTCSNDVTAWDIGVAGNQWTKAKGMDTFCPLGPWINTDIDPESASITTRVNDEVRQKGNTAQLTRGTARLLAEVSHVMTLLPGDVLLTGTPEGSTGLHDRDHVSVEIAGLGVLENPVVAES